MKTIDIEISVFQALEKRAVGFGVTPNDVIKRLLAKEDTRSSMAQPIPSSGSGNGSKNDNKTDPLVAMLESPEYMRKDSKGRYFGVLRFLYNNSPQEFAKLDNFQKGSRVHISKSKEVIEKSGRNTLPQILQDTPYWVLTNLSNQRKRDILNDVLRILRYPSDVILLVLNSVPDAGISRRGRRDKYLIIPDDI